MPNLRQAGNRCPQFYQPSLMLKELIRITSSESYLSNGGMWLKEISIIPWHKAKFVFELLEKDDDMENVRQVWEVNCFDLSVQNPVK